MTSPTRIRLLTSFDHALDSSELVLVLANDIDPVSCKDEIENAKRVDLHFPQFTDGRAYSQAYLIRRRLRFKGDLRATGDVLADQLIQMERTGFSSAVLKDGIDPADAQRQLDRFPAFYQGDVAHGAPFLRADSSKSEV
ncbi:DUF934 domain-containing protein [Trinickia mobilis]|uniref:DUF934 domain-containing protein n=1 Tax=Trinickia mobilis TaxID=2816356 RepID=UPI001A8C3928|nr:DUF934 domain-containing protein [Trinickia mobilis]